MSSSGVALRRSVFRAFGRLPRPFRRRLIRLLRPSWTAGAVGVLEREDGRWLFVKPVYRAGWTLPGGLVDRGEAPGTTVVRELAEEVGAHVRLVGSGLVVLEPEFRRLETIYRVELLDGQAPDDLGVTTAELSEIRWCHPDEPPDLERETAEVLSLIRERADGGPAVRVMGDDHS